MLYAEKIIQRKYTIGYMPTLIGITATTVITKVKIDISLTKYILAAELVTPTQQKNIKKIYECITIASVSECVHVCVSCILCYLLILSIGQAKYFQ